MLGISGLVALVLSLGLLFVVTLPLSGAAWIVGARARARADRGEAGHRGQANTGVVLGMVGTGLAAAAAVGWTLLFVFADDLLDEIERELDDLEDDDGDGGMVLLRPGLVAAAAAARALSGL